MLSKKDVSPLVIAPFYLLVLLLPTVALLLSLVRQRKRNSVAVLAPFHELRRRPPGESLRLRIDELSDDINHWILTATLAPVILGFVVALRPEADLIRTILFFLGAAVFCAAAQRKLFPLFRIRGRCQLNYQGERYVAEELNRLIADQFHTFHDVPFPNHRMNHVLVGPTGVFVVETKAISKPPLKKGEIRSRVIFDGTSLQFPHGLDSRTLEKVRRNRDALSRWLSSATADRICAEAIVTIPGWMVEQIGQSDIHVVNTKQIRRFVLSHDQFPLSPAEIHRACHQLEQKCKLAID